MALLIRQLECLQCSNNRCFVIHTETAQRLVSQAELHELPRDAHPTCGRCGSGSLISAWSDGIPYAAPGTVPRRRRARRTIAGV